MIFRKRIIRPGGSSYDPVFALISYSTLACAIIDSNSCPSYDWPLGQCHIVIVIRTCDCKQQYDVKLTIINNVYNNYIFYKTKITVYGPRFRLYHIQHLTSVITRPTLVNTCNTVTHQPTPINIMLILMNTIIISINIRSTSVNV